MKSEFAILVPCYNAERFIDTFISTLALLTHKFDEVIFFDDGSTDNTRSILENKGYRVLRSELNMGPSHARNELAKATRCEWFHFHDIDDLLSSEYLERVSYFSRFNYDVILCNVDWLSADKSTTIFKWSYSNDDIQIDPLVYTITHPIGGINGLYKKEFFLRAKGFDENVRLWEDADLHIKLAALGARFYVVEETLSFSVRHSESSSKKQDLAWVSRLMLLKSYSILYLGPDVQVAIGKEAQKTASNLIIHKRYYEAKEAFNLSLKCGVQIAYLSNSKIWRILNVILSNNILISIRMFQLRISFRPGNF